MFRNVLIFSVVCLVASPFVFGAIASRVSHSKSNACDCGTACSCDADCNCSQCDCCGTTCSQSKETLVSVTTKSTEATTCSHCCSADKELTLVADSVGTSAAAACCSTESGSTCCNKSEAGKSCCENCDCACPCCASGDCCNGDCACDNCKCDANCCAKK
jgi:hypothetical protein